MKARHIFPVLLAALVLAPTALAAGVGEVKQRMRKRRPKLNALKAEGKIGETDGGYVEPVKPDEATAETTKLLGRENADRDIVYKIIAEKSGTTPDAVAKRNGKRNWDKARPGEWYKKGGTWIQKT